MFALALAAAGSIVSAASGSCDLYTSGGTPYIAAHSTTRALYGDYTGPLYQVKRNKDGTTSNITFDCTVVWRMLLPRTTSAPRRPGSSRLSTTSPAPRITWPKLFPAASAGLRRVGQRCGNGPWIMADLENGLFSGWNPRQNTANTSITAQCQHSTAATVQDVKRTSQRSLKLERSQ